MTPSDAAHTPHADRARRSVWQSSTEPMSLEPLGGETVSDVLVIGAGMAGLSVAYELVTRGRTVVVIDDGPIGGGETARTTAHLASITDDYFHEVERVHGVEAARALGDSFRHAVDRIEAIVRREQIDCDFRRLDGFWFAPNEDVHGAESLERELPAMHRAGCDDAALVQEWPLDRLSTFPRPRAVLRVGAQAQFHPLRYLDGLARAILRLGGSIHGGAHADSVTEPDDAADVVVRLGDGRTLRARDVVVATNTPFNDRVTMHTKQAAYRTYALAARVARDAVPLGLYWDTLDPYHYVRLEAARADAERAHDLLIVGGEDHKTGQEDDENAHFDALERWTRERFPIGEIVERWSGQVLEPVDDVAFIGRNPGDRHTWIVTGDSGNGITHGALAGTLIADLVTGAGNPWESLYDPSRVSLRASRRWLAENVNVAAQLAELVTAGDVRSVDDVPAGEGRIVRDGIRKLAVHRADDGRLTVRSAVCPHLGCIVDWNAAEGSWDCPCHGSRFAIDGTVLNGPAVSALARADLPERPRDSTRARDPGGPPDVP